MELGGGLVSIESLWKGGSGCLLMAVGAGDDGTIQRIQLALVLTQAPGQVVVTLLQS